MLLFEASAKPSEISALRENVKNLQQGPQVLFGNSSSKKALAQTASWELSWQEAALARVGPTAEAAPRHPWKAAWGPACKVSASSGTKGQSNQRTGQSKGNPGNWQNLRLKMVTLWSTSLTARLSAQSMKEGPVLREGSWQQLGRIPQTSEFGLRTVLEGSTVLSR